MKRNLFISIISGFMLCTTCGIRAENVSKDNSKLFEKITSVCQDSTIDKLWESFSEVWKTDFFITLLFGIVCTLCIISFFFFLKGLKRCARRDSTTFINETLPSMAFFVFLSGMIIYYVGYAYGGTGENAFTLLIRSMLSAFEMFLSKSNLIGIAPNCRNSSTYMLLFAVFHAWAVIVSMVFAVACFWKRLGNWLKGLIWERLPEAVVHVFWGLSEKSILLAKDIYKQTNGKERILFIDFPLKEEEYRNGQSFSGIMGLLSYKANIARQISDIKYLLLRTQTSPSAIHTKDTDFLLELNLRKLNQIIRKTDKVNFYVLTDNESTNLQAALNILDSELSSHIHKLFCAAKYTRATHLLAECSDNKLCIIDDSKAAITEFAMRKNLQGEYPAHPINYVDVNKELGCVDAEKPFTALIIGFGTTGLEALKFLYEFSAFTDGKGKKTPVHFHIFDNKIQQKIGELRQDIPGITELEEKQEIIFHPYNSGEKEFEETLREIINDLNYVVIATGDDDCDLNTAAMLHEYALQYRDNRFERFQICVRMYHAANEFKFKKLMEAYGHYHCHAIQCFGSPKEIYTKKLILDDEEGEKGRKFAEAYDLACRRQNDTEDIKDKKEEKQGEKDGITMLLKFRSKNRKNLQNRANAKHCYTKEVLLGLHAPLQQPSIPSWPFTIDERTTSEEENWKKRLYNVSVCEHLRWNASHLMMGYLPMTKDKAQVVSTSCDERSKLHLCLVDWDKLPAYGDYQKYDYIVVATTIDLFVKAHH